MRLRSIVCFLFVLILSLIISGCTSNPETNDPVATTPGTTTEAPASTEPVVPAVETPAVEAPVTPAVEADQEAIAFVNGDPAYRDDFENAKGALLNQYAQTYAQFGLDISALLGGADGRMFELGIEAESLMQLVQLILTQQEAESRGIVITDDEVQAELDSQYGDFLAGQGWTEADLELYLSQQGRTLESFKNDVRAYIANQMLAMAVQKAVAGPIEITDEELNEYFLANNANYEVSERIRASHILVDTIEEAEALLAQLNEGADFAALAKEHSTDPGSGANGGDLNWFGRGAMVAPFEEAAFALAVGEVSDIVETDFGYHIILLTDREDAATPELADVLIQVQSDLEQEKSYAAALVWYEATYGAAEIVIPDPLLDAIIKQRDDIDGAIALLEQVLNDGTSDDRYLSYVLGSFYERKLTDAIAAKASAESDPAGTEQVNAEIAALQANALAAYQRALEMNPEETAIQSKVTEIEAMSGGTEEQTP